MRYKWFEKDDTASITSGLGFPLVYRLALVRSHSASRIGWHSHTQYELLFLGEGATVYELSDDRQIRLYGGQCLVIPPGVVHRGLEDVRQPAVLCGMMIDPTKPNASRNTPFSDSDLLWIKDELDSIALEPLNMSKELRSAIESLPNRIEKFDERSRASVLRMRLILCRALVELAGHRTVPASPLGVDLVDKAVAVMQEHLSDPISIRELAAKVGCSRAHLFAVFKERVGMTPNDYWQRMRVEVAFRRVTESSDSLTKIAMECGFSTSQYFCTVFRKYWGTNPSQCRLKHRESGLPPNPFGG